MRGITMLTIDFKVSLVLYIQHFITLVITKQDRFF